MLSTVYLVVLVKLLALIILFKFQASNCLVSERTFNIVLMLTRANRRSVLALSLFPGSLQLLEHNTIGTSNR